MRVGVIGICGFGKYHAEAYEQVGCDVVAVADRSDGLAEAASAFGAEPHRTAEELLARTDLDAVSVCLPPRFHPTVVTAAVARGLPVLCEKPVAPDGPGAARLREAVGDDARVMVGFSFRYHAAYRRLRAMVLAGDLGRIVTVNARKCWGTRTAWRLEKGGGAVVVKDIHYFDLVPWLLDERPSSLCAFGGARFHEAPVEDCYQLLMEFPSGAVFHLDSAWWTLSAAASHFEVVGTKARATVEEGGLRIEGERGYHEPVAGEPMLVAEVRDFTRWVGSGGPRPPGLTEAVAAQDLAQRVVDAMRP